MKHEIISDIKRVTADLGHTPSYTEYVVQHLGKFSERKIRAEFGCYENAKKAAGDPGYQEPVKIENLLRRNIREVLNEYYAKSPITVAREYVPTLVFSDSHLPFVNMGILRLMYDFAEEMKPKRIVLAGDLHDLFAQSKFAKSVNLFTPEDEIELAYEMATDMWKELRRRVPGAECFLLFGNHDVRPHRRMLEKNPESESFCDFEKYFEFEGVQTIADPREVLILDDVAYNHGFYSGYGRHRDEFMMNTVNGHTHKGGVVVRTIHPGGVAKQIWELNCALIGDPASKGMGYTATKFYSATPGFGWIGKRGPQLIGA